MNTRLYISFIVLASLGAATGWFGRSALERPLVAHMPVEKEWATRTLAEYQDALHLSNEQVALLKPEMDRTALRLRDIKTSVADSLRDAIRQNSTQVKRVLDEKQTQAFETLLEKKRAVIDARNR